MTRICLAAWNSPLGYSGGRYHAWILAEALAANGLEVTYWTNARPLVSRDFEQYPHHNAIKLHIDPFFESPPQAAKFDFAWIIPQYGKVWMYDCWMRHFTQAADRRILLNFETPNWYQEAGQKEIPAKNWIGWELASMCCEGIVSSLDISSAYAKKFFTKVPSTTQFLTLPPAINSLVADQSATVERRRNRIFFATRFNVGESQHKGGQYLLDFLSEEFRGYEIVVMVGGIQRNAEAVTRVMNQAAKYDIRLILLQAVSDRQKFEWIRSSEMSVCPSAFEGYGYPPVC